MTQINFCPPLKFGALLSQCATMGADAHALAAKGSHEKREQYLLLAAQWAELARDMQHAASGLPRYAQ